MTRRNLLASSLLALPAARPAPAEGVLDLGARRELFVDNFLVASSKGAELRLGQPVDAGPVLQWDRSWEGRFSAYATILKDGSTYRLYYRGVPTAGQDGRGEEVTCYAESPDGVHFTRPDLGLHEVHGTRKNNVILAGMAPLHHNFCPFLDARPGVPSKARFKALAGTRKSGLIAFQSADGIQWTKIREAPVLTEGAFDSQNLAFWSESEKQYLCYYRTFKKIGNTGYRWVSRAVSADFIQWKNVGEMTFGDVPPEHLYTNQTSPYFRAPHIYVAICARFLPGRQVLSDEEARAVNVDPGYFKDCSDAVMMTSRGGNSYDRTFLEAFLRPGLGIENWVSRSNYPVLNIVPTGAREMSLYVAKNYAQPSIYVRRYAMRLDGLASLHAGYSGGEITTRPLRFQGSKLAINFSTSAPGGIRVEIQDASGIPVPGFSLAEATEMIGDEIERTVTWKQGPNVAVLSGKPVHLRIALKDADLYALRFS